MAFAYILFFVIAAVSYYVQYSFQNKFNLNSATLLQI